MSIAAPAVRSRNDARIFWGSFIALVTCAFGFAVRTQVIGDWAREFNLTETQKGEILGVGFWPFAFSIFLFSLFIDRVGYGVAAFVGFLFHLSSTLLLLFAQNYTMLFWGTFLFALSNGTVESYINMTVATMYPNERAGP
jgi:MFS family permease